MAGTRKGSRRPGGSGGSGGSGRSGGGSPSGSATKALLIGFERWYKRHAAEDAHEHPQTGEVMALLSSLFELSRGAVRNPLAPVVEDVLVSVEADPQLAPRLFEVIDTLDHYLDFLVETGAWQGTDAQIDASSDVLERAFNRSAGLLVQLIDALGDVEDVPANQERAAFGGLSKPIGSSTELLERVQGAFGSLMEPFLEEALEVGAGSAAVAERRSAAIAIERVIGVLAVAAHPVLMPGVSLQHLVELLDSAAGVSAAEALDASPKADSVLGILEADGVVHRVGTAGGDRLEAPAGLRPALADAVVEIADELGLLGDDGPENPHPEGSVLQLKVAVIGSKPVVWWRLVLAAEADLGELSLAAQLSLDAADTEPHAFTLAGDPEVVYGAIDRLAADDEVDDEDDIVDENEVEVGELFFDIGDEVFYAFGGDEPRRIVMRLESVREHDDGPVPRCVGAASGIDVAAADALLAPLRVR